MVDYVFFFVDVLCSKMMFRMINVMLIKFGSDSF